MQTPLLSIRNLRVDYPGVKAVKSLEMGIGPGEAVAMIGPNGSGKTYTMRAITGLKHPTHGRIRICGYDNRQYLLRSSI